MGIKNTLIRLIIIGMSFVSGMVNAQSYTYRHYTIFDGLPQNQVMSLLIDDVGFLWVGTKGGLSRFDGKNFKQFYFESNDQYVRSLFIYDDKVAFHTTRAIFIQQDNHFVKVLTTDAQIANVITVNSNELIICTYSELIRYNGEEIDVLDEYPSNQRQWLVSYLSENDYYCATTSGLIHKHNGKTRYPIKAKLNYASFGLDNMDFLYSNEDSMHTGFYYKFDVTTFQNDTILNVKNDLFTGTHKLSDQRIIVETAKGKWFLLSEDYNIIDADSLPNLQINDIVEYNGSLFFGMENGLYVLNSRAFVNYTEDDQIPPYVWSIMEDANGDILLASYYGKMVKLKNDAFFQNIDIHLPTYPDQNRINLYMNGYIRNNGEWVLPVGGGVITGNATKQHYVSMYVEDGRYTPFCAYEDSLSEQVYLGTNNGVYLFNPDTRELTRNIQTNNKNILDIESDKYGRLWFCSSGGILVYKQDSLRTDILNDSLHYNPFVSCSRDYRGNMWLGGKFGLYHYNWNQRIKVFDGAFTFVDRYQDSHIIAGNTFGLLYIDLEAYYNDEENAVQFFDRFNGFVGKECGQNGTLVDSKGNVWIPTSESVVKFMPYKHRIDTIAPEIFICELSASDKNLKWEQRISYPVTSDSIYHLEWNYNNIRINFHGINYNCPERVSYKYRLLGYSKQWNVNYTGEVQFTNLKPGHYMFEVLAENEHGYLTDKPAIIKLQIVPAFWQTILFKMLLFAIIIVLTTFIAYAYFNRKRKREQQKALVEHRLINMQINTINSQLDPHFVFNAISAIGTEVQQNNTEKAYNYFVKATRLFRSSLKDKDQITRTLSRELDVLSDYLSLQKLRFGDKFSSTVEIDDQVDQSMIVPKMCIQLFVENAVKHGLENKTSDGFVNVKITKSDDWLFVEITDNGIGREAASKIQSNSSGIGLSSMKKYFYILNKYNTHKAGFEIIDRVDDAGKPSGTIVRLRIPLNYNYSFG
jgi:ligand-binding sensor domain-containing protein